MDKFFISTKLQTEIGIPVEIMRTGEFTHARYGVFEITENTMDEVLANFVPDRIAVDFNHNSAREGSPEETRAAGWIQNIFKENQDDRLSLMAEVRWTEAAQEFISNEEFRFVSPEFTWAYTNPETGETSGAKLLAFALTNRPFLPGMSPVTLAQTSSSLAPLLLATVDKVEESILKLASTNSISDMMRDVTTQFHKNFRDSEAVNYWIEDVREDNVVVRRDSNGGSDLFQIEFEREDNSDVRFSPPDEWTKVKHMFVPTEVSASDDAGLDPDGASLTSIDGEDAMNEETLRGLLSIGAEDSIEDAIAALTAKVTEAEGLQTKLEELTTQVESLTVTNEETEAKLTDGTDESVKLSEENAKLESEKKILSDEMVALSDRLDAMEQDRNQKDGQERIDRAIETRKMLPAEVALSEVDGKEVVPAMRSLAFDSPDVFDSIIASRSELPLELTVEQGSGDKDTATLDPKTEYWSKVRTTARQLMSDDAAKFSTYQLAQQEARKLVETENPQLAEQAKKAS
jgi:phage I-like protein